jgi:hypothetical protein
MSDYQAWFDQHLQNHKVNGKGFGNALCPLHEDSNPSLKTNCQTGWVECRGCNWKGGAVAFAREAGLPTAGLPSRNGTAPKTAQGRGVGKSGPQGEAVAEYVYTSPEGKPLYKVVRYRLADGSKTFRQFRYEGGVFKLGMTPEGAKKSVPRVLLHLDRIHKADPSEPVWLVEGEKDAVAGASLGLLTTTAPEGAGKFHNVDRTCLEVLKGRDVFAIPDNDDPGRDHVRQAASILALVGAAVRIVELPGLPPKGDLSDWLAAGGKRDQLVDLAAVAPLYRVRPYIEITGRLRTMTADALEALERANQPPTVFQLGGTLARLQRSHEGEPELKVLDTHMLRGALDRCAEWGKPKKDQILPEPPPIDVVHDIMALPPTDRPFPPIERIVRTPGFDRDGRLDTQPGFHPAARVYYHPTSPDFRLPPVPREPTPDDIRRARGILVDDLLGDFPFADQASLAHAVAAMLLGPARNLITGPTPFHLIDAPARGTGKGLLAKTIIRGSLGVIPSETCPPSGPYAGEEWRKMITSQLARGPSYILLDNLEGEISNPALAVAFTSEYWTDRILGGSQVGTFRNLPLWIGTGNNLLLGPDEVRRTLLIRLDARCQTPSERTGFRHDPLEGWILENLPRLVWALLTLIQAWLAAGRPRWRPTPEAPMLGSYEGWCYTIGGILEVAGIPGFLTNRNATRAKASNRDDAWRQLYASWREDWGSKTMCVQELFPWVEANALLDGVVYGSTDRARRTALGAALKGHVGVILDGYILVDAGLTRKGTARYQVLPAGPAGPPPEQNGENRPEEVRQVRQSAGPTADLMPRSALTSPSVVTGSAGPAGPNLGSMHAGARAGTHGHAPMDPGTGPAGQANPWAPGADVMPTGSGGPAEVRHGSHDPLFSTENLE